MPMMKSPAGDMEISVAGMTVEKNQIVAIGKFGAWDSKIYLTVEDIVPIIPMMLQWKIIHFICKLPFLYIKSRVCKKANS